MIKNIARLLVVVTGAAALVGCGTTQAKRRQLERVAKDWCLTIRASQVIPVYPLTEDLRPGDVFLVQTPIDKEPDIYQSKGFLPLEQMLVRIYPDNYEEFYGEVTINENTLTPFRHREAGQTNTSTNAPRAAFPTYNFSISRGGGAKLALPISGVPVAFNLMQTRSAKGSVTISDAATYGVDVLPLYNQVKSWVNENAGVLSAYLPPSGGAAANGAATYTYLRVVNRVYLTRGVSVSLSDNSVFGAAGSAGADKPITLPTTSTNANENYTNMMQSLNASVADAVTPGGCFKFTSATGRGVSLAETFPRPLVVGYLGFDVPIINGAEKATAAAAVTIGAPIDTQTRLDGRASRDSIDQMAADLNIQRKTNAERIVAYVTDEKTGQVNVARLRGLLTEKTGAPASMADKYLGQPAEKLLRDLQNRYSGNVDAIARNLPKE